jgi:hypothetical protein
MADFSPAGSKPVTELLAPAGTTAVSPGAGTAVTMPALTPSAVTLAHAISRIFTPVVLS